MPDVTITLESHPGRRVPRMTEGSTSPARGAHRARRAGRARTLALAGWIALRLLLVFYLGQRGVLFFYQAF